MIFLDKNTGYCPKCNKPVDIDLETIVLYTWEGEYLLPDISQGAVMVQNQEINFNNNREFKDMPILCIRCFEHLGFYNDVEKWRNK
jgi:hypothetical protein